MPKIIERRNTQIPKVYDNSEKSSGYYPAHQTIVTTSLPEYYKIPITSASFTSTAFSNGSTIYYDIEKFETKQVRDLEIKLTLTASGGDLELVPSFWLFDEIALESSKGSGDRLGGYIYPETMLMWNALTLKDDELKYAEKHQRYKLTSINSEHKYKFGRADNNTIRDGDTVSIYVKIPFNFVQFQALDFSHIDSPLRIRLKCSNDVVVTGDVNNLSLDNIELCVLSSREETFDNEHRLALNQKENKYIFLETERITYNNKTLTAGVETKFDLQSANGKCPFLIVVIKPSTTPSASDESLYDYVELGPGATIDIQNSAGQSEISASNHNLDVDLLEKHYVEMTGSKNIQGFYCIPFNDDFHKSVSGTINGFYSFYNQRVDLCIKPDSAGTSEVQAVDLGITAADDGSYAFQVDGEISDYLDYNATTTDMKSALESMKCIKDRGYTATFSATAENGSFNITFDQNRDGRVSDELGIIKVVSNNLNDGSEEAKPSTTVSTYGKKGWNTGSNYQVEIIVPKFVELCVSKEGKLSARDL